jgi:predicted dehydrogenase
MNGAIVGAGSAGLLHALSLRAHGVRVAGVFDPDRGKARALAELTGASVFNDVEALARSNIDFVSVTSPPRYHVEQAAACAREGRAVFVEKPVALKDAELGRLSKLPGVIPIVQWRAGRAIRAVRRAVAHGEFGEHPSVAMDLTLHRDEAYFRAGRATRDEWGCGALLSVGIHAVDAACFALDRDVDRVAALVDDVPSGMEKTAGVLASFRGGAILVLRITFDAGPDRTRFSVAGGGVTATIEGTEVDPTTTTIAWASSDRTRAPELERLESDTEGGTAAPLLVPFIGNAIAAWRRGLLPGDHPDLPSIYDVAPAHALVFRAYRSAIAAGV